MIIAIDGPAGSGKTTVSKLLAKKLNIFYLDTGATYRALTYKALEKKLDLSNESVLAELALNLDLKIDKDKIFLDGVLLGDEIRTPIIDKSISIVVTHSEVRKIIVALQRKAAQGSDYVVEGRDITTVVFPQAKYKFYLDANPKIRAKRRFKELCGRGVDADFDDVDSALKKRDYADKNRDVSPLKKAKDAIVIDTTNLTIEGSVQAIAKHIS